MLTRLNIRNFRCFPSLDVELKPLTVLIGPNNTGKSAFLEAIRILSTRDMRNVNFTRSDSWRFDAEATIELCAASSKAPNQVHLKGTIPQKRASDFSKPLNNVAFVRLPSGGIACQNQGFSEPATDLPMGVQGENLAAVIDFMLRKDRKRFDGVISTLRDLVPGFEDLSVDTPNPATRSLGVVMDDSLRLQGDSLSVGLRNLIFFTALAYHPKAPDIVLIEEPELGVHPKRLGDIMRLLRSISAGEHCDHPAQVILTTHSPFLLDHVDLENDQLLIFQREESIEGARTARPADRERLKVFLDEFMLGEVWLNEEEPGLIGR